MELSIKAVDLILHTFSRTDIGVRWSIPGVRAILMTKLEHKYRHGRWSPDETIETPPIVRMSLNPLLQKAAA